MRKRILVAGLASSALALGLSSALGAAQPAEMLLSQIVAGLEQMGYTAFDEIERERTVWEIEATSPNGARVDLTVDPVDGRILSERPDR